MTDEGPADPLALTSFAPTRLIRRRELRRLVPLSDTTIYELELSGQFPRRFRLTPRCVVWDLTEIEAWLVKRRKCSEEGRIPIAPEPNVRLRRTRPVSTGKSGSKLGRVDR
jgi:prophage regulatory protein